MPTIVPRPGPVKLTRDRSSTPPSPRLLTIRRSSPVARCLFGVPDSKDTMEFAQIEMRKEQQRLSQKYNFDFETDTPLVGNFVYEPIEDVPDCLRDSSPSPKKTPEDVGQRKITEFMGVTKPSKLSLRKRRTEDEVKSAGDPDQNAPLTKSPRVEPAA